MDHYAVSYKTYLFVADYLTVSYISSAYDADSRYLERISYLYCSQDDFLEFRIEHTLHSVLYIIDDVVDYSVCSDLYAFTLCDSAHCRTRSYIESDYYRIRRACQHYIRFIDRTYTCVYDLYSHLVIRKLFKR